MNHTRTYYDGTGKIITPPIDFTPIRKALTYMLSTAIEVDKPSTIIKLNGAIHALNELLNELNKEATQRED